MIDEAAMPESERMSDVAALESLLRRVERLEELLRASTTEVVLADSHAVNSGTGGPPLPADPPADPAEEAPDLVTLTTARRRFLKLAGAAAAGSLAFRPTAAAAADGANLVIGNTSNLASSATRLQRGYSAGSGIPEAVVTFESSATGGSGDGVVGRGIGAAGAGVLGSSPGGFGVLGESQSGYALYAGGNGRIGFEPHLTVPGPPPTDLVVPTVGAPFYRVFRSGDLIVDSVGSLWACTVGNVAVPSTPPVWRRLSGPATAGQLHLLPSPKRAYDSRPPFPNPGDPAATGGDGPLVALAPVRTVNLALGWDGSANTTAVEVGSSAALINLTITQTVGGGFLAAVAASAVWAGNSTTNWSASNQTVALTTIVGVDAQRRIDMRARGGAGASAQFIVDVIGYFR